MSPVDQAERQLSHCRMNFTYQPLRSQVASNLPQVRKLLKYNSSFWSWRVIGTVLHIPAPSGNGGSLRLALCVLHRPAAAAVVLKQHPKRLCMAVNPGAAADAGDCLFHMKF